uniref:Flagellar capping protein n=1 Tax=Mesocestoides corti TaxID=53468 RepID=A0A5K3FEA2_MESCO
MAYKLTTGALRDLNRIASITPGVGKNILGVDVRGTTKEKLDKDFNNLKQHDAKNTSCENPSSSTPKCEDQCSANKDSASPK